MMMTSYGGARPLCAVAALSLMMVAVSEAHALNCTRLAGLAVDADGAPNSYRVDGKGLSYTCDGVFAVIDGVAHTQKNDPRNWQRLCAEHWNEARSSGNYGRLKIVGFLKDAAGAPVVQKAGDPLPEAAFVTTTALTVPGTPSGSQRHYVDAVAIPYLVLSAAYAKSHRIALGDVLAVYRPKTGRLTFAIYGDCCSLGEGSVRLHQDLGSNPLVTKSDGTVRAKAGMADTMLMVPLSNASTKPTTDAAAWRREIAAKGAEALTKLGGVDAVKSCTVSPG